MSISLPASDTRVADVEVTDEMLTVILRDGRRISAPLSWFPRLLRATAQQRRVWRLNGPGFGIHWPEIDEDLSVEGLLRGERAPGA